MILVIFAIGLALLAWFGLFKIGMSISIYNSFKNPFPMGLGAICLIGIFAFGLPLLEKKSSVIDMFDQALAGFGYPFLFFLFGLSFIVSALSFGRGVGNVLLR